MIKEARDAIVGALVGLGMGAEEMRRITESIEQERVERAQEGLADLELSLDDIGWRDLSGLSTTIHFSREALRKAVSLSRIMYIVNPLIKRAVTVQELYVWGSGCSVQAEDKVVDQVLKDFFEDPKNEKVIGQGEEGWTQREREQRIDGNTFFALFTNRRTGAVRVRLLPYDLVEDIICNPEDSKEVWFYKRRTSSTVLDGSLSPLPDGVRMTLYPDILYNPRQKPKVYGNPGVPVDWTVRVMHVKTGGLSSMKFGLPELYAGLNWATAYKKILENFATILSAYARMAMKMTGLAGKKGIAAAKSKLNTGMTSGNLRDGNPPSNTASWMMLSGNVDIQPIKTAHSTTAPDEARALRSMVASAADLPEHFFGDSEVGNFATSETLDRPTELKMIGRQQMWRQVMIRMAKYVIEQSSLAARGKLRDAGFAGAEERDAFDGSLTVIITPPAERSLRVTITFPNITERAVADRVRAVVLAATLNGRSAEGIIPDRKFLFKLLLDALGVRDAEDLTEKYYPEPVLQGFIDPADKLANDKTEADAALIIANARKEQAENPPEPAVNPKPAARVQ